MSVLCKHIPLVQDNNKVVFTGKDGASMGDRPYYISGKEVRLAINKLLQILTHEKHLME